MIPGKLILYGILALAIMGMIGTGVYKIKEWGADGVRLEWKRAQETQRESDRLKSFAAATGLQADRGKARTIIEKRTVHVDREVTKTQYRDICLPDTGLCLANATITGTLAPGCLSDGTVPAVKPAG